MGDYKKSDIVDVVDENDQPLGSVPKQWIGTDLLPASAKKAGKSQSSSEPVEVPDGEPTEKWTVPQLDLYASEKSVDGYGEAKDKKAKLELVEAHYKAAAAPQS